MCCEGKEDQAMSRAKGTRLLIRDAEVADRLIEERKRKGIDRYDEVWEGLYVIPPIPTNAQLRLVSDLGEILTEVVKREKRGEKYQGANVSDRRKGWDHNYRVPDMVVVLNNSQAVDCGTHFFGGPDFLIEIQSPGDDTEDKVPFYGKISVRELLIIHRDKRTLRLLRLEGDELVLVKPSALDGKDWLVSAVLPLAFRRTVVKGVARPQVRRSDDRPGLWTV
jgi:Uma2 family endonuclease